MAEAWPSGWLCRCVRSSRERETARRDTRGARPGLVCESRSDRSPSRPEPALGQAQVCLGLGFSKLRQRCLESALFPHRLILRLGFHRQGAEKHGERSSNAARVSLLSAATLLRCAACFRPDALAVAGAAFGVAAGAWERSASIRCSRLWISACSPCRYWLMSVAVSFRSAMSRSTT